MVLLVILLVVSPGRLEAAPIHYLYDPLGRLIAVVDIATEAAIYRYDAVGNLLSIVRQSSSQVTVIDFFPRLGPEGSVICVLGIGFSPTAGQNTVTLNGVPAEVVSASETEICVLVPAGSTTGLIAVTSPNGSDTSEVSFTSTVSDAPTITGFAPVVGGPGMSVTVTGTNFDVAPANDRVAFNLRPSSPTTAFSTSLTVPVPQGGTSGRLKVTTPTGQAVSTDDFFVPPSPFSASQVEATGRVAINGASQAFTITQAGKIGMVVFDGTAGQAIGVGAEKTMGAALRLYHPDGSQPGVVLGFEDGNVLLQETGTYTFTIEPGTPSTGSLTLTLSEHVTAPIEIDGPAVNVSITRPGQDAFLTFPGTTGQFISVAPLNSSFSCCPAYGVLRPDGTFLAQTGMTSDVDILLPETGIYQIALNPGVKTGDVSFLLSGAVFEAVTIDGPSVGVETRHGQNAYLNFSGVAGQRVSIAATNSTYPCCPVYALFNTDSSLIAQTGMSSDIDVVLPSTGTFQIGMDAGVPAGGATFTVTSPVTGVLPLDGTPVTLDLRPGQDGRLTFDGVAGQRVGIGFTNNTLPCCPAIKLLKPDETELASACPGCGQDIDVLLPVAGTYTLTVDAGNGAGSIRVFGSTEIVDTIAIDGSPVPVTTIAGQNARLTFDASAGQRVSLGLTGSTYGCCSSVVLLDPGGVQLASACPECGQEIVRDLTATGTYTITVDAGNLAGGVTLTLSEEISGALIVNAPAIPVALRPAQNARFTFDGSMGQVVTVRVTGNTMCVRVTLLNPAGGSMTSTLSCGGSFNLTQQALAENGVYTVFVDPSGTATGSLNLSVTSP